MNITIPCVFDFERMRTLVGGEPVVLHCHHYNTFLQRSIQDADYIDSEPFLIGAAAEVSFAQLTQLFEQEKVESEPARKEQACELYRWAGFGTLDFSNLNAEGGRVDSPSSHYAMAWKAKFGPSDKPVCHFAMGWIAGAMAAIYNKPQGHYRVAHPACSASDVCQFELAVGEPNYKVFESVQGGLVQTQQLVHEQLPTPVDMDAVTDALLAMDISGDADGIIPAFGVYLTRHYANYYNRISFESLRAMSLAFGEDGYEAARDLFVEAGHVCAFNTFGGIMTSPEWQALIAPQCNTREDWVHGMVAAVNALGWGRWECLFLNEDEATFAIHDDYESVGYLGMYGIGNMPISFLAEGAAAGIMNLVYVGDVASNPEFTPEFYDRLFKGQGTFVSMPGRESSAMGDQRTLIHVKRCA